MEICSYLLNKFLTKKFIFCAFICANKQTENTVKKKITYFLKKYVGSLFTFPEKVFAIFKFFTARCLNVRFLRPFAFYLFEVQSTVLVSYSLPGENELIYKLFSIREGKKLCVIFAKSQKLCLHKIFNIGSTTKVNSREFCVFILDLKWAELQYC